MQTGSSLPERGGVSLKLGRKIRQKLLAKLAKKTQSRSEDELKRARPGMALFWIHVFSFWTSYRRKMRRFSVRQSMQVIRCIQSGSWHYHSLNPLLTDYANMKHFLTRIDDYAWSLKTGYLNRLYYCGRVEGGHERPSNQNMDRAPRILVLTANMNFIVGPVDVLLQNGAEVRVFDTSRMFEALKELDHDTEGLGFLSTAALYGVGRFAHSPEVMFAMIEKLEPEIAEALTGWCDTVFCDWASHNAIWFSKCIPAGKRLVVRCHSYEAFSHFPVFMRHSHIDCMIFIAPHIQDIYLSHPLDDPSICDRSVFIQNLRPAEIPIAPMAMPDRSFQLGMLGFGNMGKDPIFAIEVLQHLVQKDRRWRLHLAGHDFGRPTIDEAANEYAERYRRILEPIRENIIFSGFVTDKAKWFAATGFVLSTSQREGSHEAVVEGLAHGCVPALRDWPLVSGFEGAARSFPDYPSFDSPTALADHILRTQARFTAESERAKAIADKRYYSEETSWAFFEAVTGQQLDMSGQHTRAGRMEAV